MEPEHYSKHQHFVPCDAIYELRRCRARVGNEFDEIIRIVAEKGNTDEVYKNMLLSLLTVGDEPEPCKEKTDNNDEHDPIIRQMMEKGSIDVVYKNVLLSLPTAGDGPAPRKEKMDKNDVVEQREKHVPLKKRKIADNFVDQHDDRGRARVSDKNKVQCARKNTRVMKQKNLVKKEKEGERINMIQIDNPYLFQKSGSRNKRVKKECPLEHVNIAHGETEKVRGRRKKADGGNGFANKKSRVSLDNDHLHHENCKGHSSVIKQESDVAVQAQPVKIYGEQIGGKLMGVVKEEYVANEKNEVKKENEKICQLRRSRRSCVTRNYCEDVGQVQLGEKHAVHGQMGSMEGLAIAVKEEPDDCVEIHVPIKGIHSRNGDGKYVEGQSSSKTVPEVEILHFDTVVKEGIFSPFIPSKQFHCSMADGEPQNHGLPSAADEFRKELLKILRKPFDKAEYQKCREAFRVGRYNKHHPGLQRKLTRYRNKREKCLVLLRGFLFWLQNVAREGSFEPWKDVQCLAVELPTVSINL